MSDTGGWVTVTAACGAAAAGAAAYYAYRRGYEAALVDGRRVDADEPPNNDVVTIKKPQPLRVSAVKATAPDGDEDDNPQASSRSSNGSGELTSPQRPSTPNGRRLWCAPPPPTVATTDTHAQTPHHTSCRVSHVEL